MRTRDLRFLRRPAAAWLLAWLLACAQLLGSAHGLLHAHGKLAGAGVGSERAGLVAGTFSDGSLPDGPFRHAPGSADCALWAGALGADLAVTGGASHAIAPPPSIAIEAAQPSSGARVVVRVFDARGPPAA
jgi:hypothetical protein